MKHFALVAILLFTGTTAPSADTLRLGEDRLLRAAAQQVLTGLQHRSFRSGREFCGLLGRNTEGKIVATRPRRGNHDSCRPGNFLRSSTVALASYHTHGAYDHDADSEVPSFEDLSADIEEGLLGYVATPGGRLWVNNPDTALSIQLCGLRCLPQDRHFQQGDWGVIAKRYTLRQLKQRRQLY